MAETRTWLTTPTGQTPVDDDTSGEHWVRGPSIPTEPRPPSRFRGTYVLVTVYAVVIGLTFLVAPSLVDPQDPTFGGDAERLDATEDDPTFERPTSN